MITIASCLVDAVRAARNHTISEYLHLNGENNPNWTGDDASYGARHQRLHQIRGEADHCALRPGLSSCTSENYYWAQIHGTDGLDVRKYVSLCGQCHNAYDHAGIPKPSIRGNKHRDAKLTEAIVLEIRSRPVSRGSISAWAREFGVGKTAIRKSRNRRDLEAPRGLTARKLLPGVSESHAAALGAPCRCSPSLHAQAHVAALARPGASWSDVSEITPDATRVVARRGAVYWGARRSGPLMAATGLQSKANREAQVQALQSKSHHRSKRLGPAYPSSHILHGGRNESTRW